MDGRTVWLTFWHRPLHATTEAFAGAGFRRYRSTRLRGEPGPSFGGAGNHMGNGVGGSGARQPPWGAAPRDLPSGRFALSVLPVGVPR
jgi:hypothetical protein